MGKQDIVAEIVETLMLREHECPYWDEEDSLRALEEPGPWVIDWPAAGDHWVREEIWLTPDQKNQIRQRLPKRRRIWNRMFGENAS